MNKLQTLFTTTHTKIISLIAGIFSVLAAPSVSFAQITNPAIGPGFGGDPADAADASSGMIFSVLFIRFWQMIIVIGTIAVLVYFVWGALDWIIAGGDSSKIQKGRDRIIQAVIGMIILAGSFAIISFINNVFFAGTVDLLQISF